MLYLIFVIQLYCSRGCASGLHFSWALPRASFIDAVDLLLRPSMLLQLLHHGEQQNKPENSFRVSFKGLRRGNSIRGRVSPDHAAGILIRFQCSSPNQPNRSISYVMINILIAMSGTMQRISTCSDSRTLHQSTYCARACARIESG